MGKSYKSFSEKIQFHTECIKNKMFMHLPMQEEDVLKNVKKLESLLEDSICPHCDGSGAIPHQFMNGEWDFQQCQWCDEKNQMLYNFENNG